VHEFSRFAAENLLNSLPFGLAIAGFAWAGARALRKSGSRIRFAIWFAALAAIVVAPWAGALRATSSRIVPALQAGALSLPESSARYLFAFWLAGAVLGLLHVALGLFRLRRLRATCVPVELSGLDSVLRATLTDAQSRRRVTLCVSEAVRVPAAFGYFRPVVVFPKWALSEFAPAELNAILVHELAHLRRYDDWTNLAQKVAKALFFFHPAVWFIESRLTLEREMACDDAVLAANFSARAYAESLVGLAEKSYLRRGIQLVQAAVSHVEQLKLRLAEILRKDRPGQGSVRLGKPSVAILAAGAVLGVYGMAHAPRLVEFDSDSASAPIAVHSAPATTDNKTPHLTNASFTADSVRKTPIGKSHTAVRPAMTEAARPTVLQSKMRLMPEDPAPPQLVLTGGNAESNALPVLLIFQGRQFGPNGPVLWRVTVVHLTPYQQQILSGQTPKQI
jgi:beta-lactamase regulating signal transducer with metallopeptidase domain